MSSWERCTYSSFLKVTFIFGLAMFSLQLSLLPSYNGPVPLLPRRLVIKQRGEGSGPKWGRRINHSNFSLSELLLNASTPRREGSGSEKGRQKHHSNFSLLDLPHNVGTHRREEGSGSEMGRQKHHSNFSLLDLPHNAGTSPTQKKMLGVTRKLAPSPRVHVAGHDGHDGFELAAHARKTCRAEKFPSPGVILPAHLHTVASLRVVFCPMEKIGTTFWRRLLYMLTCPEPKRANYSTPFDVPIDLALKYSKILFTPVNKATQKLLSDSAFSFMFVRNPYDRLLSAFIDKLVAPNPTYWNILGLKALQLCRPGFKVPPHLIQRSPINPGDPRRGVVLSPPTVGHDITFPEFIKYVTASEMNPKPSDNHIISIRKGCKPCTSQFTYIGRMETFSSDAFFIMKKLGMNKTVERLQSSMKNLSIDDAITDSIRSPFEWKKDIRKFITWDQALQRIWLKLQMRGIIEFDIKLNMSSGQVDTVSEDEFINLARAAHKRSNADVLKKQKDEVRMEAFRSVPLKDLNAFKDTYREDFLLFGYEMTPQKYYNRGEEPIASMKYFNYNHLN
ncbi:uncharacterized protein LOC128234461 [Mya arenaria]|uniref:uncharacterized protein LOC128234461 n=1 Tax=Mya arenaria TaxID=6604 RepID=UPI0022E28183|nr:uncharacterized protein LOC128234461 [Mya arenaria]XP_052804673.1 uncharacterized protein LOC128234461 [Mya arenaria]XP_052804674.1 uncharacterized protein LOC128234461 [Mya arenaria]